MSLKSGAPNSLSIAFHSSRRDPSMSRCQTPIPRTRLAFTKSYFVVSEAGSS